MTLQLDHLDRIIIDGQYVHLKLMQRPDKTVVYTPETNETAYREYEMPHEKYAIGNITPAPGVAGSVELENDIKELVFRILQTP